jgi:hypothetical protein
LYDNSCNSFDERNETDRSSHRLGVDVISQKRRVHAEHHPKHLKARQKPVSWPQCPDKRIDNLATTVDEESHTSEVLSTQIIIHHATNRANAHCKDTGCCTNVSIYLADFMFSFVELFHDQLRKVNHLENDQEHDDEFKPHESEKIRESDSFI